MTNMTCKEFDRALAMEWALISTGAAARRALLRWAETEPALVGAETPADVVRGRAATADRRALPALHFGAMLACFPFFGVVAKTLGQHLQSEGSIAAVDLRAEVRGTVGDRPAVDVAARKSYTTMRNLGLVAFDGPQICPAADPLSVCGLDSWLMAAVLATRQATELPLSTVTTAPELLGLRLEIRRRYDASLVEVHGANGGAVVALRRR